MAWRLSTRIKCGLFEAREEPERQRSLSAGKALTEKVFPERRKR
jgi:hypothetical protein